MAVKWTSRTTTSRAAANLFIDRVRWNWDLFLTGEWKVRPDLTMNIGLRYELQAGWREGSGRQAVFDIGSGGTVVPDGSCSQVSPLLPASYVEVAEASSVGYHPTLLIKNEYNNFAPPLGIARRPFGMGTVFRAGWGLFYDIIPRAMSAGSSRFVINQPSLTSLTPAPTVVLPMVFPASVAGPTTISLPASVRQDLRDPHSMQYNLTIKHQRWDTGFLARQWAMPDPTGTAYTSSRTPAQVTIRPDLLRGHNLATHQRSTERWCDISVFAAPTPGRFGTSAKNVITDAGGEQNLDAAGPRPSRTRLRLE